MNTYMKSEESQFRDQVASAFHKQSKQLFTKNSQSLKLYTTISNFSNPHITSKSPICLETLLLVPLACTRLATSAT